MASSSTPAPAPTSLLCLSSRVHGCCFLSWSDGEHAAPRPLSEPDILVVAAYSAQILLIEHELLEAGLNAVRVGTVDKFQSQEGVMVFVSMASSTATGSTSPSPAASGAPSSSAPPN